MSVIRIAEAERNVHDGTVRQHCLELLADGKPRTAIELVKELQAAKLAPPGLKPANVWSNLLAYVRQELFCGRKPQIIADERNFTVRLNQPLDDWPAVVLPPRPRYVNPSQIDAIADRLEKTSEGDDSSAFEAAVCDAFAMMGFVAEHIGGHGQPDGMLTAPLGSLAYRVVVECKSSAGFVRDEGPDEVAKFRESLGVEFALLIARRFNETQVFLSELQAHAVSCWTTADLVQALRLDVDPYECRSLLQPGEVDVALRDLAWARLHGAEKRAVVLRDTLRREGYAAQVALRQTPPAESPALTLDAALLLVETALRKGGATTSPTREEVADAMHDLVRAGEAAPIPNRDAIVIRRP